VTEPSQLVAVLTLTQTFLSIIKLLSTHLLRQQELLALNTVRRFPHLRGRQTPLPDAYLFEEAAPHNRKSIPSGFFFHGLCTMHCEPGVTPLFCAIRDTL
jgi:hypothetical protein